MRLHKHHIYMHTYTKLGRLDVKISNLGASQVNYITYSIVLFLFSQFVLTIIFVVSLSSGDKTTIGATSPL